jgi:hypothetical protein
VKTIERFSIFSPDFCDEKIPEDKPISPQDARQFVEDLGYKDDNWDNIMHQSLLNHEIRGLIYIARKDAARTLEDVYLEQYPDGNHNSLGDIEAQEAAEQAVQSGKWEEFMQDHKNDLSHF